MAKTDSGGQTPAPIKLSGQPAPSTTANYQLLIINCQLQTIHWNILFRYYFHKKTILLYQALKIYVRIGMKIFCRRIIVNKPQCLQLKGPLLLACNHPNSFLDAIILDIIFDQPIWSLARGDVFKNAFYTRLLTAVKIMPVYRTSEGAENLLENYKTFDACYSIFKANGLVQIFSEGKCINEWHLRPLKKGTARLAFSSWEKNIPLKILPVGINYSSFRKFGKNIFINFGDIISAEQFSITETDGKRNQAFNEVLRDQLNQLVIEIRQDDFNGQKEILSIQPSLIEKVLLAIPAAIGFIVHAPLYLPIKKFVWKRCNHNDHFDSVLAALLLVAYPLYMLMIVIIALIFTKSPWSLFLFLIFPFTAWSFVQLNRQTGKV